MGARTGISAFQTYTRESDLQRKIRRGFKAVGLQVTKLNSGGGIQDLLVYGEPIAPAVVWLEVKTTTGVTSDAQLEKMQDRRDEGYLAFIVPDYDYFLAVLDTIFNRHG